MEKSLEKQEWLTKLSMQFADAVIPESKRPLEVRSCVSPEYDRSVNFTCFKILAAATFKEGFLFSSHKPIASPTEIACAAIDYTLEHDLGNRQERLNFFRRCFREGALTERRIRK